MIMKFRLILFILLFVWFLQPGFTQSTRSNLDLTVLIDEALQNNPDLKSAQNSWQAAKAKIPQAGALPDPTLSFNLMNLPVNSFDFDQEPMTGKQIAVMQMFPFPGKQGLKEDIAKENSLVAENQYIELKTQLIKNVKTTYYSLFFVDKSLETIDKNTRALEEFVKIAETKYSVGKGLQQDVLRAQVELSKMEDKRINLEQKRESLESRLNALLNRPVDQELGNIDTLRFIPLPYDYAQLTELTEQRRPLLQAWEAMIRQSDKKVNLAKKEYLPDFSVGLAYSQRDALQNGGRGVDFFSGMFSVKVPLYFWRKQRKQVEENRYQRISVQEKYNQIRNQIYSDLEDTFTDVQKNKRLVELFQTGIIPQAMQSLNSAIAGYQTDKVDFLTLLNNQINLFNFQLDYYRILTDYNKNIAQLEAIVGEQLIER